MNAQLTFGEQMRRLRRAKKWNLQQVAEATGLSYSHLSRMENDSVKPKADTVIKISDALDGDLTEMLALAESVPDEILQRMREREEQPGPTLQRSTGPRPRRPKGEALALARAAGVAEEEVNSLADLFLELLELPASERELVTELVKSLWRRDDESTR